MSSYTPDRAALDLAAEIAELGPGQLLLVVTGAGISAASGIPTFRGTDPDAIWTKDVTELATERFFRADPVGSWRWYLARFDRLGDAEPNEAHRALVALERWQLARGGDFQLITQNIDTLHERAGSERLLKVHGSSDRLRCSREGCALGAPFGSLPRAEVDLEPFRRAPSLATLPRCSHCQAPLRPHVLWFDEYYEGHVDYRWQPVLQAVDRMALALAVGTSFAVGFTEVVLRTAQTYRLPAWSIDPSASPLAAGRGLSTVAARAEELLPWLAAELGAT